MDMTEHSLRLLPVAHANEGHEDMAGESDQVIVIDPEEDRIIKRISLGSGQHLAHVVLTPGSKIAVVVAQETGNLYLIDAEKMEAGETVPLPEGSGPHGLRLSPDGTIAYVALMDGKGLGIVDLTTKKVTVVPAGGSVVQTAVTPDGAYVAATVYETRSVAVYDTRTKVLESIRLPDGAQGPVQIYPSADSRFMYVADQGVLQGRGANDKLYKVDLIAKAVTETITAGKAPHGVALNSDDSLAFVSNQEDASVSIIDLASSKEIKRIVVGEKPNGITVWKRQAGDAISLKQSQYPELAGVTMEVYKSPGCSCCGGFINELKEQSANVVVHEVTDDELAQVKEQYGIKPELQSCHTTIANGYVIEGHVPFEVIAKLLSENPDIEGIALPGMPSGTPGMPGPKTELYEIKTLSGGEYTAI
jgi:YVTN family beta-propeller protein